MTRKTHANEAHEEMDMSTPESETPQEQPAGGGIEAPGPADGANEAQQGQSLGGIPDSPDPLIGANKAIGTDHELMRGAAPSPRYSEEAHNFRVTYVTLLQGLAMAGAAITDKNVHGLAMRAAAMVQENFDLRYPKDAPTAV